MIPAGDWDGWLVVSLKDTSIKTRIETDTHGQY